MMVLEMIYGYTKPTSKSNKKRSYCRCLCDCGKEYLVDSSHINRSKHPSCGCVASIMRAMSNRKTTLDDRYGRLVPLEIDWSVRPTGVVCKCDCGNTVTVKKVALTRGITKSCGCLQKDIVSKVNTKDQSGYISPYGVTVLSQSHQNEKGQWLWNCQCGICGASFVALPARIKNGHITSCGCRRQSSREQFIEHILVENGIKFRRQVRFPECKDKYTLPFDFGVLDGKDEVVCLIEYDGKQHVEPVPLWGGENELRNVRRRDKIKNDYCLKMGIPLLRLSHLLTDRQIEEQLLITKNP